MAETVVEENPFRPDGNLNHEVDPIVETYKRRPFPTSPSDEYFKSATTDLQETNHLPSNAQPSPTKGSPKKAKKDSPKKEKKGETNSPKKGSPQKSPPPQNEHPTTAQVQHHTLATPQSGKVELVHLEEKEKRKCCCTIQ